MDLETLIGAPVEVRIVLGCRGGVAGVLINNRWLKQPCRHKRCRRDGVSTVHIFDILTGRMSTVYEPLPQSVGDTPMEGKT